MEMDEDALRFAEVGRLINERLRTMSPAERDQMLQRHMAEAMSPEKKFKAVGMLIDFALQQQRMRQNQDQ
ncbi:MAG TPA: hypothetical protein VNT79_18530 [Phycisphaerae bacterium]|nr:hypothetical protein [Phycisphaerae bacterium]